MSQVTVAAVEPLFASPLFRLRLDGARELNARLLPEIYALRDASSGAKRSNHGGWHSESDFFQRTEPACSQLRARLLEAIGLTTRRVAPSFDPNSRALECEGWVNVNGQGAFNTPHDHPGWTWSGSYYVRAPAGDSAGTSGNIEFLDVRTNARATTIDGANCFASKVAFRPEEGSILIFPSYLRHWVYPNEQTEERVSIAFNARFR
jgi:uncharacterized protein (TIGR02466 family)